MGEDLKKKNKTKNKNKKNPTIQNKKRGLNSHQFKELLNDLDPEYDGLVYHAEVWWLSPMRFYELQEVRQFCSQPRSLSSHIHEFIRETLTVL